ncbi:hypothetical protein J4457_06560 [Candidatus Woesearchaeota archaeon]|nr:hypothetical protein [Candidatus Woesearchaeota archaeon]
MKTLLAIVLVAALLVVSGCGKGVSKEKAVEKTPTAEEKATPGTQIGEVSDEDISALDKDLKDVDQANTDLDTSDLDSLDKDLAELENMNI